MTKRQTKWRDAEVDVRLAKKNATIIRGAMRSSFEQTPKQIVKAWLDLNPMQVKAKKTKRADAIAFLKAYIKMKDKGLLDALANTYADFDAFGKAAADSMLGEMVNWAKWKPGNQAAANLVRPKGALAKLLRQRKIIIKGIQNTKLDRIATVLADGLERGDSVTTMAKAINEIVDDPRKALAIAHTEGARAQVMASRERYQEAGVTKWEWITADPCELCEDCEMEAQGGVPFGYVFTLGDGITEPPAHPECRCDIVPVVDSVFEEEQRVQEERDMEWERRLWNPNIRSAPVARPRVQTPSAPKKPRAKKPKLSEEERQRKLNEEYFMRLWNPRIRGGDPNL